MRLFKRNRQPYAAQPAASAQSSFILEPILTPTVGIDGIEGTPDLAIVHLPDHPLPTVDLSDHPLPTHTAPADLHTVAVEATPATVSDRPPLEASHSTDLHHDSLNFISDPPAAHGLDTPLFDSGFFTVGESGQVDIDYLFDGGSYQGELAVFSLRGMECFEPGSQEFIHEAARRALSDSNLGHIVISDATEGARFHSAQIEGTDFNSGEYQGVRSFQMCAGDTVGFMLVPNGEVKDVLADPGIGGDHRPLFSMASANPNSAFHAGQIADVTGEGNTFVFEDQRVDGPTDHDYNDVIFQVRGATGEAVHLDQAIDHTHDWRTTDMGKALLEYTKPFVESTDLINSTPSEPLPQSPLSHQPLIGVIDTGFNAHNPNIDYSHITVGHDYVQGDNDSFLEPGQDGEHGTHVLGVIAANQGSDSLTAGINDQAPVWVSRAVGSGQWADSLVEFVDAAKSSAQPHAVVNLSFDLTQINPDGSVTTRYELTPTEWAALEYARQNHVLIVAAAGNDGSVMSALGQASQVFDNIITTGAAHTTHTDASVAQDFDRTDYSSYGYGLDLVAEGGTAEEPILSTVGDDFGTMAGTSVAAAKVTGAASQVWAANPDLSYRQVIEILKSTTTDLKLPDWDLETGSGLLNIAAAVHLAKATQPENYETPPLDLPITWSGEGLLIPLERAVGTLDTQAIVKALRVAIIGQESGNNYRAVNPDSGALGFAQVMPANIPSWSQAALGYVITPQQFLDNPALQLKIVDHKLEQYWQAAIIASGGNQDIAVRRVASAWYSGQPDLYNNTTPQYYNGRPYPSIADYTLSVLGKFNQTYNSPPTPPPVNGRRPYIVQRNDTLSGIAQRLLNDANRWREISKDAAGQQFFTEAEARLLQIGRTVYLPVNQSAGGGNPITPTPITPTPTPTPNWQRAIDQAYANSPVNLGLPTSGYLVASRSPQGTTGMYRQYQNGTIHWTQQYGAVPIWFDLQREYSQYNQPSGSGGWLGFPTRREYEWNGGKRTDFEGGYIFWNGQRAKAYRNGEMPPGPPQPTRTGRVSSRVGNLQLNFRSSPAVASNNQIGQLSIGTSFKVLEQVNGGSYSTDAGNRTDWLKIQLNSGQQGYVAGYYVDIDSNSGGGGGGGNTGGAMTREGFINWATGQVGIRRLDGYEDLRGQCVTLIARYVEEVFLPEGERTRKRAFGNGKDTASVVAGMLPNSFEPLTRDGLPRRGAIISFPGPDTAYGHTAIVMESRNLNGQRQVRIMDSNGDNRGVNSTVREYYSRWINIDSSGNGYGGTNGWTNPR